MDNRPLSCKLGFHKRSDPTGFTVCEKCGCKMFPKDFPFKRRN